MKIKVDVNVWLNETMQELTPQEKMFYMYLVTNDCLQDAYETCDGLSVTYKITKGKMSEELGLARKTVTQLLKTFERKSIAFYNEDKLEIEFFPITKGGS